MQNTWLGSDSYQFLSYCLDTTKFWTRKSKCFNLKRKSPYQKWNSLEACWVTRTGWLGARLILMSGISGPGAGGLVSQWGSTIIKSLRQYDTMCTVTCRYLSWSELRCWQDVKLQQPTNYPWQQCSDVIVLCTLFIYIFLPSQSNFLSVPVWEEQAPTLPWITL